MSVLVQESIPDTHRKRNSCLSFIRLLLWFFPVNRKPHLNPVISASIGTYQLPSCVIASVRTGLWQVITLRQRREDPRLAPWILIVISETFCLFCLSRGWWKGFIKGEKDFPERGRQEHPIRNLLCRLSRADDSRCCVLSIQPVTAAITWLARAAVEVFAAGKAGDPHNASESTP